MAKISPKILYRKILATIKYVSEYFNAHPALVSNSFVGSKSHSAKKGALRLQNASLRPKRFMKKKGVDFE